MFWPFREQIQHDGIAATRITWFKWRIWYFRYVFRHITSRDLAVGLFFAAQITPMRRRGNPGERSISPVMAHQVSLS